MIKARFVSAVFLFLAVRAAGAQTPSDKLLLRLHVKPGQALNLTVTTSGTTSLAVGATPTVIKMQLTEVLNCLVTKVADDGSATMATTVTALRSVTNINGKETVYDSGDTEHSSGPMAMGLGNLVGATIATTTNPLGKVIKIEGLDDMVDRMLSRMPASSKVTPQAIENVKKSLKKIFSDQAATQGSLTMGGFPVQPLAVGDSWVRGNAAFPGLTGAVKTTMTLKARHDGRAVIAMRVDMAPASNPRGIAVGDYNTKSSIGMHGSGTEIYDEATGLMIGGDFNLDSLSSMLMRDTKRGTTVSSTQSTSKMSVHIESSGVAQPGG